MHQDERSDGNEGEGEEPSSSEYRDDRTFNEIRAVDRLLGILQGELVARATDVLKDEPAIRITMFCAQILEQIWRALGSEALASDIHDASAGILEDWSNTGFVRSLYDAFLKISEEMPAQASYDELSLTPDMRARLYELERRPDEDVLSRQN